MPTFKNNILDSEIIEAGIIPSLISWKSDKPIYQMKKNQFELISFEIGFQNHNNILILFLNLLVKLNMFQFQ